MKLAIALIFQYFNMGKFKHVFKKLNSMILENFQQKKGVENSTPPLPYKVRPLLEVMFFNEIS